MPATGQTVCCVWWWRWQRLKPILVSSLAQAEQHLIEEFSVNKRFVPISSLLVLLKPSSFRTEHSFLEVIYILDMLGKFGFKEWFQEYFDKVFITLPIHQDPLCGIIQVANNHI